MIKKIIFITVFLLSQVVLSQKSESIYYDKDWKVTTKSNALYYRLMPVKEVGELVLLQDFYINGTPQFEGYVLKKDENTYVGDVVWYDENGNDSNFYQYRNDTKNLTLLYYYPNGKVRKKVQYKNGVKDGEAVIYGTDGTVLMKGVYIKGKPESGSFENIKNSDDYRSTEQNDENSESNRSAVTNDAPIVEVASPEMIETAAGVEAENPSEKREKKNKITQKIFWANSKQLAQETVYEIGTYDFKPISRKDYDKSGKLIQSLNETHFKLYGNNIENGTEYQYYLQNNFATQIRSASNFVNGDKSGKEITYFPDGNVAFETNYKNGLKEGDEIVFNVNGTVKSKRIYKENEPFNGNFDVRVGEVFVNLNYINGLREGEAIAKDEGGRVIAKGIYRNGKPFNGTFVEKMDDRSDNYELMNFENFKKTGLQKVFAYRLENLEKTYTVKDEKLNGLTTFYDNGKVVGTVEYKNDLPYNGTLIEDAGARVYKDGKISEETFFQDHYNKDRIQKQKLYGNGVLEKIKNYSFTISEKPQDFYEGIFKNGKPFSGYFETEDDREFKQVNYFENGILKFQYSNDYLKNMDNYAHQVYNIKSIYKDGKIFDGVEYNLNKKQFISRYWKNGVLQSFDWDLFAMHYFNRIHFELKNNTIEIGDLQANRKAEIKIDPSKTDFNKQLFIDGKLIDSTKKEYLESKYKEGITIYHVKDGKIVSANLSPQNVSIEPSEGTELFYKVYSVVNESSDVQKSFNDLSEKFISNKFMGETDEKEIIAGIKTDSQGKPKDGILITPTQNNTYTLQLYFNRNLIKTVDKVRFGNIKDEIKKLEGLD
ncbi:toxin-antitoxin system YwqK family antitoxin [Chryseobacterium sp. GP-SGM7]|uniref:toxin-antitoxin system YwqK family antitoxin n=1 Tax=Chryseobacterium sp. GP-SGM7 TaxID=3411323 RepID=UPI003B93DE52